jgi:hypothetical protein
MKNKFFKIVKFSLVLAIIGYITSPSISSAATMLDGPAFSIVNNVIGIVGNFFLTLTAQLLTISGTLLNLSLNITTHVGDFYNSIPALNEVWLVVRNMSSIFIIFALLYSSIMVIVGAGSSSATKELIVKIVIAGVLINFSLFFTKVLIDGSNLVSLQFYRAIAPKSAGSLSTLGSAFNSGGLSDVFMSSFRIPAIYQNNGVLKTADVSLSIGIATIGGMLMMVTAAISLLGASVAIMFRTAYLIFIMAVSPIYFAAMIFPQLEDKAKEVTKIFKAQLIFMPTYLFLMYVALKLISSPGFTAIFNPGSNSVPASGEGAFGPAFVGVVVQFIIASIFINAPLIAAIAAGASGAKFAEGWTDALNKKIKGAPGAFGSAAWRNTGGKAASLVSNSDAMKSAASKSSIAAGALRGMKGVAKSYNENVTKKAEETSKFAESLGYNKKTVNYLDNSAKNIKSRIDAQEVIINDPSKSKTEVKTAKDQKKIYQRSLRDIENKISDTKRERQVRYAQRIDPRDIDTVTGKMKPTSLLERFKKGKYSGYVFKDEEVASAQIHIKNTEGDIEQLKKALEDKKKEQDEVKKDIKRLEDSKRKNPLTPEEQTKLDELKADLFKIINGDNDPIRPVKGILTLNQEIRDMELEVKNYKNKT